MAVRFGLSAGSYSNLECVGFGDLRSAGGGDLDRCPSDDLGGRQVIGDRTAGLSVPILGVWRPAVYRWKSGIWITASSPAVLELVGAVFYGDVLCAMAVYCVLWRCTVCNSGVLYVRTVYCMLGWCTVW